MEFEPFLLDEWLNSFPDTKYDLGSSTGPVWSLDELTKLIGGEPLEHLAMLYQPAAGSPALREQVARLHGVSADEVLITTGASEALNVLFFTMAEPGSNVVLPHPVFSSTRAIPKALGTEIRSYRLRAENGFRVDLDEVRSLVDKRTKLLLVNSPHNPTGAVLTASEWTGLQEIATEHGVPLVSDEVYIPMFYGTPHSTAAALPNAIVAGSFSKSFCLSGLRLGWLIDRNAKRREKYLRARMYFTICNSAMAEVLGARALEHREVLVARTMGIARRNIAVLHGFFNEMTDLVGWVPPDGSSMCFPWLKSGEDSRPFCASLAQRGVLMVPGDCFGMPLHFRIGFAKTPDLAEALPIVGEALKATAALAG